MMTNIEQVEMIMIDDKSMDENSEIDGINIQQVMIANEKTGVLMIDGNNTETTIVEDESINNKTIDDKEVENLMMDNQKVTNIIASGVQENQQNFLKSAYAAQSNRPKESYMHFLPSEKFQPRNLRKVGCEPIEQEPLKIVETPKTQRKCLSSKRKGILMGSICGALVVGIGLAIVLTLLIERSSANKTTTTTQTTTTVTTATTTSATTSTSTSTSSTSSTSTTSTTTTTSATTTTTTSATTTTTTSATTTTTTSATTTTTTTSATTTTTTSATTTTTTTSATTTTTTSATTTTTTTSATTTTTTSATTTTTTTSATTTTSSSSTTLLTSTYLIDMTTSELSTFESETISSEFITSSDEITTIELTLSETTVTTSTWIASDITIFSTELTTFDSTNEISKSVMSEDSTNSEFMMATSEILLITPGSDTSESTIIAPTSYWISGAITDLDPSILLANNWTECYNATYNLVMNTSEVDTALMQCNKGKLLLACKPIANSNYTLAAMGLRADVLFDCSTNSTCIHVANDVGWYFSDNYSWGFVNGTDNVNRDRCDNITSINPSLRLCWNTDTSAGGYRCGSTTDLDLNATWQRSIWHTD